MPNNHNADINRARIRKYKDKNGIIKYEVLDSDGVRRAGELSFQAAKDYLTAHRSELQESAKVVEGVFNYLYADNKKKDERKMLPLTEPQRNLIRRAFPKNGNVDIKYGRDGSEYVIQQNAYTMHGSVVFHFRNEDGQLMAHIDHFRSKADAYDRITPPVLSTDHVVNGPWDLEELKKKYGRNNQGDPMYEAMQDSEEFNDIELEDDDAEPSQFFVAIYDEDGSSTFVGKLSNDGRRWVESNVAGEAPYNWPSHGYMSYLSVNDVMQWIYKDYSRGYEIKGPFYSKDEAIRWASRNFSPIAESEETGEYKLLGNLENVSTDELLYHYKLRKQLAAKEGHAPTTINRIKQAVNRIAAALADRGIDVSTITESEETEITPLADLTKIKTSKLQEIHALHRHYAEKEIHDADTVKRLKSSVNRVAAELARRGVTVPTIDESFNEGVENRGTKWCVHYAVYGTNSKVPLYTKTLPIYAETAKDAAIVVQQLTGGHVLNVDKMEQFTEAKHGLNKRVKIVKGPETGKTGTVGEVRHGQFKGAKKEYTIDLDDGGNIRCTADQIRLIKDEAISEGQNDAVAEVDSTMKASESDSAHKSDMSSAKLRKAIQAYKQDLASIYRCGGSEQRVRQLKAKIAELESLIPVTEATWSKNPSGTWTNNHTGRAYSKKGGGIDNGGNSSYMTLEYMLTQYKERLASIEASPYKREKEVAQLKAKIAKLEGSVTEGIFDMFKKKPAEPEIIKPSLYPDRNNIDQWMADTIEYYKKKHPNSVWTLFCPSNADYLPVRVSVATSSKVAAEHINAYRALRDANPAEAAKAKENYSQYSVYPNGPREDYITQ